MGGPASALKGANLGAESEQQRSCSDSSRDLGPEPLPGFPAGLLTCWRSELAKTNFRSVHFPRENADALPREMTCMVPHATDPGARPGCSNSQSQFPPPVRAPTHSFPQRENQVRCQRAAQTTQRREFQLPLARNQFLEGLIDNPEGQ